MNVSLKKILEHLGFVESCVYWNPYDPPRSQKTPCKLQVGPHRDENGEIHGAWDARDACRGGAAALTGDRQTGDRLAGWGYGSRSLMPRKARASAGLIGGRWASRASSAARSTSSAFRATGRPRAKLSVSSMPTRR